MSNNSIEKRICSHASLSAFELQFIADTRYAAMHGVGYGFMEQVIEWEWQDKGTGALGLEYYEAERRTLTAEIGQKQSTIDVLRNQIAQFQGRVNEKSAQVRAETKLRVEAEKRLADIMEILEPLEPPENYAAIVDKIAILGNPERYACDPICEPAPTCCQYHEGGGHGGQPEVNRPRRAVMDDTELADLVVRMGVGSKLGPHYQIDAFSQRAAGFVSDWRVVGAAVEMVIGPGTNLTVSEICGQYCVGLNRVSREYRNKSLARALLEAVASMALPAGDDDRDRE